MSNEFNNLYEFENFRLDPATRTLWQGDMLVPISPKAFELLKLLIERQGSVVSKQDIFDRVWPDTFVEDGVLTQNIYTLRQALGTDERGKQYIENVARRGYRLTGRPKTNGSSADEAETAAITVEHRPSRGLARFVLPVLLLVLLPVTGYLAFRVLVQRDAEEKKDPRGEMKFQRLTDTGDASYLTISADGKLAAYTRGFGIFVKDLQTNSELKVNVESDAKPACLQFSPDGGSIYFGTVRNPDQRGVVYRVPREGGVPVTIAENVSSGFSLAPDGGDMAFMRRFADESRDDLVLRDMATGAERTLKSFKTPERLYWNGYPAWSADGSKIAAVVISPNEHFIRLLLLDRAGTGEREIKIEPLRNVEQVVWNAAGDAIIAAANEGDNFQIWRISLTDGSHTRITNDLNSYLGIAISADRKRVVSRQRIYYSNIWVSQDGSPRELRQLTHGTSRNDGLKGLSWIDDERLVYSSNDEKIRDWNLWTLNTTDGARQKVTSGTETQNEYPVASPDKKYIYFASDRKRESRIWRVGLDGSAPEQMTFGENESHFFPQVSPDGAWLYFVIKNAKFSTIGRKSLQTNSVQELSGARSYVPGNFLTLSPDGKYLAFENISVAGSPESPDVPLEVGLISTEDPQKLSFLKLPAWIQRAEWGPGGRHLDFVNGNVGANGIARKMIDNDAAALTDILSPADGNIFNFAWSPNGRSLAISRGQLSRDVVLITDFE